MFGNPLAGVDVQQAQQPQAAPQPPAFKAWADTQVKAMSGGAAASWDDLDRVFDALPPDPTSGRKTDEATSIKQKLLESYRDNILPQYYTDPKHLAFAKASIEASVQPHILASAFKPVIKANEAGSSDPLAKTQDSYNRLMEDAATSAADKAAAGIGLDKMTRMNGNKVIDTLKLRDVDTSVAADVIAREKQARVTKAADIEAQYNAGQIEYDDAQTQLDALYRESQNLDGALNELKDTSDWLGTRC